MPATLDAPDPELAELAERYGLELSGVRPSLLGYLRELWGRRYFITAFSTAKLTSRYSEARLGQLWQVVTPLLQAFVFYLVFGVLLQTRRGVPDYVPFLVTGVFVWAFTQGSVMSGVKSISGNLGLVRALHFPRASLPIALCLQQFQQLLFSMGVLLVILLAFGQPPRLMWLAAVPALALQSVFNAGLALAVGRAAGRRTWPS